MMWWYLYIKFVFIFQCIFSVSLNKDLGEIEVCNQLILDWAARRRLAMTSGKDNWSNDKRQNLMTTGKDNRSNDNWSNLMTTVKDSWSNEKGQNLMTTGKDNWSRERQNLATTQTPITRNIPIRLTNEPSGK